ncbi:unnamed protein product, partial [Allacma fusca]
MHEYRTKLQKKRYIEHHALEIILVSEGNSESLLKFLHRTVQLGEPHRDYFVFLGEAATLFNFFKSEILLDLKYKIGVSSEGKIFKDPKIFSKEMETTQVMPSFEEHFVNLNGRRLKLSAAPIPPYISFTGGAVSGGAHYLMLYFMGEKYNYTMEVDTKNPQGTGYYDKGMWNGMTGDTYYRRADVGLFMGITADRYGLIDTIYTQPDVVFFMTRQPEAHPKWQAVFYPYTPTSWLWIFISFVAIMLTLYLKMWRANVDHSIYKSIFIPYQISLDQGFDIQLPGSVKFITAVWMLFIIVISTGYRCDLVS